MNIQDMNREFSSRSVEMEDLEFICKLPQGEEELFFMSPKADYPLSVCQLEAAIQVRKDSTVILFHGKIVGFANFYVQEMNAYCSIGNVIVDPRYRNKGIGKYLIGTMEKIAKEKYNATEVRLSCFNQNTKGILLYTKLGYKPYDIVIWEGRSGERHALIEMKKQMESL